jgi:hypothetical protein
MFGLATCPARQEITNAGKYLQINANEVARTDGNVAIGVFSSYGGALSDTAEVFDDHETAPDLPNPARI